MYMLNTRRTDDFFFYERERGKKQKNPSKTNTIKALKIRYLDHSQFYCMVVWFVVHENRVECFSFEKWKKKNRRLLSSQHNRIWFSTKFQWHWQWQWQSHALWYFVIFIRTYIRFIWFDLIWFACVVANKWHTHTHTATHIQTNITRIMCVWLYFESDIRHSRAACQFKPFSLTNEVANQKNGMNTHTKTHFDTSMDQTIYSKQ